MKQKTKSKAHDPFQHLVLVRWIDSISSHGWGDTPRADVRCLTCGFLVEKSATVVIVALNECLGGTPNGDYISIPRCAVLSIKRLSEK
jgi:hypothetical protein